MKEILDIDHTVVNQKNADYTVRFGALHYTQNFKRGKFPEEAVLLFAT
jgi:hypothetical protein